MGSKMVKVGSKGVKNGVFGIFSTTVHKIFLKLDMKLKDNSRKKLTEPDFLWEIWFPRYVVKRGKNGFIGQYW